MDLKHPSWRKVISQLREIFNELHLKVDEDKIRSENLNLSDICLEANQKYINSLENECKLLPEENEERYSIKNSFRIILKVWKLCQIIFIKSSPPGSLLLDLQDWYRSTNNIDPKVQALFSKYVANMDMISNDDEYWLLILISVAQGRTETARHLLNFHPAKTTSVFKSIDEQLRTMPNFSSLGHLSLFEFKAKWEYWQKKCIQILTNENFESEQTGSLELICKMLCAEESTFLKLKPIFGNWYYMLISLVSYSNPTFNISDLHLHLSSKTCMREFEDELDQFDTIIHNIFDFDVESVISDCVEIFGNHMFSAHLMDILFLNGKLQLNKKELSMTLGVESKNHMGVGSSGHGSENATILHEEHLSDYATQLLGAFGWSSSISIYNISFDYLKKCTIKKYGIDLIEEFMEKIPLENISEVEANKVFYLASKFDFDDLAFGVGRCMQMRALKKGMYGTALGWNVRIKDMHFGTVLAEKIIEQYWTTEDLNLLDLTENLTKEIIFCDRLIFLSKYKDFLKLTVYSNLQSGSIRKLTELKQAASILVQLLEANNLVPIKYRRKLIMDVLPLVRDNALSEEQIYSVLRSIQNYENRIKFFPITENTLKNKKYSDELNILDVEANYPIYQKSSSTETEFTYHLDNMKWQELLVMLSEKLASTVALKSVEISN